MHVRERERDSDRTYLLLFQFVGAEDENPVVSFGGAQPFAAAFQLPENFFNRNFFLKLCYVMYVAGNLN